MVVPSPVFQHVPNSLRMRDATTASSLAGAVITRETVSRSGTATTSATGATVVGVPRGPVKLVGELTGYTAGEPVVVYLEVCNHEVLLVITSDAGDGMADCAYLEYGST